MAIFVKAAFAVLTLVTLFVVLVSASHAPSVPRIADMECSTRLSQRNGSPADPPDFSLAALRELETAVVELGNARSSLLRQAAQAPDDLEALEQASLTYRDSILRMRNTVAHVREHLGPERANQLVRMMMSRTMMVSQGVLIAEIFGQM